MNRHKAIIARLGGYAELASLLGLEVNTVRAWGKQGRAIPSRYWHRVTALDPELTPTYLDRTKANGTGKRRRGRAA